MVSIYFPYSLLNPSRALPIIIGLPLLILLEETQPILSALIVVFAVLSNIGKSGTRFNAKDHSIQGTYKVLGYEFGIIKKKLPPIEYVSVLLSKSRNVGNNRFGQKVYYGGTEDKFTVQLIFDKRNRKKVSERHDYVTAWEDAFTIAKHFNIPIYNASERELANVMIYPKDFEFYEKQLSTL